MVKKTPAATDVLVGMNIRFHRQAQKMSQETLGQKLGVTFQQVQKYEKGANRVGASRLFKIAEILEVPVSRLFEGAENLTPTSRQSQLSSAGLLAEPHILRVAQALSSIKDTDLRLAVVTLVEKVAAKLPARK